MGHEVGLHLDPFDLIRKHGDLDKGLTAALADLRGRGLTIRAATLHGDTSAHIRARNLFAHDFFMETQFRSTWDGQPPEGEPGVRGTCRALFLRRSRARPWAALFRRSQFVADGAVLAAQPLAYLSDNRRTIALLNVAGGEIVDTAPFRISEAFAEKPPKRSPHGRSWRSSIRNGSGEVAARVHSFRTRQHFAFEGCCGMQCDVAPTRPPQIRSGAR